MNLSQCNMGHRCNDGGMGACSQANGHYGRHLCGSCLNFFGGGEAIRPDSTGEGAGAPPPGASADGPGAGGGYVTDSPGLGGGYLVEKPGSGSGSVKDSPGLGGGYEKGSGRACAHCHALLTGDNAQGVCPACGHPIDAGGPGTRKPV